MAKLNFHMGVTLRCYGNVEVEADSIEAAFPMLTADFVGEHIDITQTTTDSGQDLAIIDVSDADTGEELADYGGHSLPSPYDPQPDAKLLATLKGLETSMAAILASDDRRGGPAALVPEWLNDIRAAIAKAEEGKANG
ncbi:IclR family transcriptional regulator (plasmid) [Mesorhizobium loti]|uniref:hypothetical protein n=1 Tax=Mesorhizobium sp. 131-2-5 TaxID=2744519 RepID=UPI00081986E9|nr:hypothetical protein [Mesorhizobium sp. 131-2-5]BAV52543.1 IclR family transcriptional regulator [Mesorhizobium loti]BCH05101.1 hypothetical protein MesoLj131b_71000 [Mesorhizobium sp. 131-2-5]